MTNSNPSRFFISFTKYLQTEVRKHRWRRKGRDTKETQRMSWRGTEKRKGVRAKDPGEGNWTCSLRLPGKGKGLVDTALRPLPALGLPHEPQLQTVHTAATLHHFVSRVQGHIIKLVLLEEVAGQGSMAVLEQVLWAGRRL